MSHLLKADLDQVRSELSELSTPARGRHEVANSDNSIHELSDGLSDLAKFAMPALIAVTLLTGCGPDADTPMKKETPIDDHRFNVERVGVFEDDLAYGGKRGIYIFTDKETGEGYIGVSGIGVSELGSHMAGKVAVGDEKIKEMLLLKVRQRISKIFTP